MLVLYEMIVVDIETSGLDHTKCGIWQIGAVDLDTREEFIEESRIDDEDLVSKEALLVIGKTEKELRNPLKQTQKQLLENFFNWYSKKKNRIFVAQNPQFDLTFLDIRAKKYNLKLPCGYRAFDLHSFAVLKYYQITGKFHLENKSSGMSLSKIISFCGCKDERIILHKGKVVKKGKSHNALEDAKLEAECFSRLVFGRSFFKEYSSFEVPMELKK
jgi:DNA polymerase III epsilon subunit-like protein